MTTVYKIRNAAGLFSTGGSVPKWRKTGKTWSSKAALKSHFTLIRDGSRYGLSEAEKDARLLAQYSGCFVVTYSVDEAKTEEINARLGGQ